MLRLLSILALTSAILVGSIAYGQEYQLNDSLFYTLPAGYAFSEDQAGERKRFLKYGDGPAELSQFLPDHHYSSSYLEDWFHNGATSFLTISVMSLPPEINSDEAAHELISSQFKGRWGKFSFYYYDSEKNTGHFVNYAGAFVSVTLKKLIILWWL